MALTAVRIGSGAILALLAVALPLPALPWTPSVAGWDPTLRRGLVLGGLLLAALLLPRWPLAIARPWRSAEATALSGGLVLMLEPLLFLAVLAIASWQPLPSLHALVLPPGDGPELTLPTLLSWVLAPALIEEWFFRGRLLPLLARFGGGLTAVTVSAGLFAAAHGGTAPLLFALPLGLVLGWVRLRSPSLYPCVFAHALHNLLALAAGGALVIASWLPAVLLVAGAWLVTLAWAHHQAGDLQHANRRFAVACTLVMTSVLLLLPLHRLLHQSLWTAAASAVLGDARCHPLIGTRRLAQLDRDGRLDHERQQALVEQLLAAEALPLRKRVWLLAALQTDGPARLVAVLAQDEDPDQAVHPVLLELIHHPEPALVDAAVEPILQAHPASFARFLRYEPLAFREWLPQPQRSTRLLDVLQAVEGRDRDGLYRLLFQTHSPELASSVLLRLPPRAITQRDRYQLRKHHPDPDALLARLAQFDRARALAWGWQQ